MITLKLKPSVRQSRESSLRRVGDKAYAYCLRNIQGLFSNPKLFVVRKFARFELIRNGLFEVHQLAQSTPEVSSEQAIITSDGSACTVDDVVKSLESDGYFAGLQLSPDVVEKILEYAKVGVCWGDRNPNFQFPYAQKEQMEAKYNRKFLCCSYPVDCCPAIMDLINSEMIQAISAHYLKAQPVYVAGELLWSYAAETTQLQKLKMAQVYHYDLDDIRSIKFFFYLNDVDMANGAHVCIQKSHRGKKFMHQLLGQRCASIADEKIVSEYGVDNVLTLSGKAGFGFAEDPMCFHKGAPPISGARLMLQLQFSVNDLGNIRACRI